MSVCFLVFIDETKLVFWFEFFGCGTFFLFSLGWNIFGFFGKELIVE
jgi:hypothetical protein